jgi:hypothetical protein
MSIKDHHNNKQNQACDHNKYPSLKPQFYILSIGHIICNSLETKQTEYHPGHDSIFNIKDSTE